MDLKRILAIMTVILAAGFFACGEEEPEVVQDTADAEEAANAVETVEVVDPEVVEPEMTEEEKMAYVMANCICPQCPSWIPEATEKGEGGYCATGISECIVLEAGCICPECPVTQEMGLEWGYYCTRGSVEELAAAAEADPAE